MIIAVIINTKIKDVLKIPYPYFLFSGGNQYIKKERGWIRMKYTDMKTYYQEKYRPQFHFSPIKNWMNDPNGLVYYQGEYHLFYQYNPEGTTWGPMYWGHAVSENLVHWEHLPIALEPDHNGMIFSGSVVVDWHNSSGFFNDGHGLVAVFTHADSYSDTGRLRQRQSLAYSNDKGRTWVMYEGNPVLCDEDITDFRDPKVYWFEEFEKWIMILVAGDHIRFYGSKNLKNWEYLSGFYGGSTDGVWECPDFFKLPVEGTDDYKWVLEVDVNPGGPYGGSGAQYFIGNFDGNRFINDNPDDTVLWLDYGKDYYAGVSWSNVPESDGRRLWIAWMSNWQYANKVPTSSWRSATTFPRELTLKQYPEGIRMLQCPINELEKLRKKESHWQDVLVGDNLHLLNDQKASCFELVAEFELDYVSDSDLAHEFGFKVRKSKDQETVIGYNTIENNIFVDRINSGKSDFNEGFPGIHSANLYPEDGKVKMHILVDWSSVEVFGNNGKISITDLIFPDEGSDGIEIYCINGRVMLKNLEINYLDSIWEV